MIKVIVGSKGSGKTARLVEDLNAEALDDSTNVVCIQTGSRLDRLIKPQIRLVDIMEYPVQGFDQLLSFIAGIRAKDFDITHVYIDSIQKVAKDKDLTHLEQFLQQLNQFCEKENIHVMIILSAKPEVLPQGIRQYC